jgi:hypothetical protein
MAGGADRAAINEYGVINRAAADKRRAAVRRRGDVGFADRAAINETRL